MTRSVIQRQSVTNRRFASPQFQRGSLCALPQPAAVPGRRSQTGVGTALNLGRSASQAEIVAFAQGRRQIGAAGAAANASQILRGFHGLAAANQNNRWPIRLACGAADSSCRSSAIPNVVEPGRTSDDKFTYTARLAYDVSDNINAYVSYRHWLQGQLGQPFARQPPADRATGRDQCRRHCRGQPGLWHAFRRSGKLRLFMKPGSRAAGAMPRSTSRCSIRRSRASSRTSSTGTGFILAQCRQAVGARVRNRRHGQPAPGLTRSPAR